MFDNQWMDFLHLMNMSAEAAETLAQNQRRFGRLRQDTVACNLGSVIDLSLGGMRVNSPQLPPNDLLTIVIDGHPIEPPLQGRVVWSRPIDHESFELGIAFEPLAPSQSESLNAIARDCRNRRTM